MRKKLLYTLLASSLLSSASGLTREPDDEPDKIGCKKTTWSSSPYQKTVESIQGAPTWVWWTGGSIVTATAVIGIGYYFYNTGVFSTFLNWGRKDPDKKPPYESTRISSTTSDEYPGRRATEDRLEELKKDIERLKNAVVDVEKETYGTTFLEAEPEVRVDGKDIYIIDSTKDNFPA